MSTKELGAVLRSLGVCTINQISAAKKILFIPIVIISGSNPTQEELDDMIDVRQSRFYAVFENLIEN